MVHLTVPSSRVSIPYRYATNGNPEVNPWKPETLFQFLIGTLQTKGVSHETTSCSWFQFLIGTLQTEDYEHRGGGFMGFQFLIGTLQTSARLSMSYFTPVFQFLIGTLQTRKRQHSDAISDAVSIPYRYATNLTRAVRKGGYNLCFNSL